MKCIGGLEVCTPSYITADVMAVISVALSPKKITVGDEGEIRAIESGNALCIALSICILTELKIICIFQTKLYCLFRLVYSRNVYCF